MIYAVGDIHGKQALLRGALRILEERVEPDADSVVFMGDYIDRGTHSREVIDLLLGFGDRCPRAVFLRGNHEQMMLDAREGPPPRPAGAHGLIDHSPAMMDWIDNGGFETLISYGIADYLRWWEYVPAEHWAFLEATRVEWMAARYGFVHAGLLPPGMTWEGSAIPGIDPRLWIREPFLSADHDFGRTIVVGHTPQKSGEPLILPGKIGIDTAAAYGGPLTIAVLDDSGGQDPEFVQVCP